VLMAARPHDDRQWRGEDCHFTHSLDSPCYRHVTIHSWTWPCGLSTKPIIGVMAFFYFVILDQQNRNLWRHDILFSRWKT
jgi:hypothetical protein